MGCRSVDNTVDSDDVSPLRLFTSPLGLGLDEISAEDGEVCLEEVAVANIRGSVPVVPGGEGLEAEDGDTTLGRETAELEMAGAIEDVPWDEARESGC